jgi:hypothetical protein
MAVLLTEREKESSEESRRVSGLFVIYLILLAAVIIYLTVKPAVLVLTVAA